jgi:hypothetical protein
MLGEASGLTSCSRRARGDVPGIEEQLVDA